MLLPCTNLTEDDSLYAIQHMGLFNFFKPANHTEEMMRQYKREIESASNGDNISPGAEPFVIMTIEETFFIKGRGVIVLGSVVTDVKTNQSVIVRGSSGDIPTSVIGVEVFGKPFDFARAGDKAGLVLGGITRGQVRSGDKVVVV